MPSSEEKIIKNVHIDEDKKKKSKKAVDEIPEEEVEDVEEDSEETEDSEEDSDEELDEDEDDADGLTDIGLYNVLGNFLVDEEGNNIATSMSNIAKELAKLNHILKKNLLKSEKP